MGKPIVGRWFVGRAQMRDGIGNVGAVPERDCGDDEVEAGGAKLLRLAATIGNPALLEGADDLRRGVTLLALVEASMRLTEAGAIKVFGDIRSGKTMERPGLEACSPTPARAIRSQSCVSTGSDDHSANC